MDAHEIHPGEWIMIALAVVAIVIAVQGFVAFLLVEWLKSRLEKLQATETGSDTDQQRAKYSIVALRRFNASIETNLAVLIGIISSLADKTHLRAEFPKLDEENQRLQNSVRKLLQEAFLVSDLETRRFAAIQELSNRIGDDESLERMKEAAKFFPEDKNFGIGIQHLESRLGAYRSVSRIQ